MNIVLGRARKLEKACAREAQAILKTFERDPNIRFSAHATNPPVRDRLNAVSNEAMQQLDHILTLYRTQARIRALIGKANAEHGVNDSLAERAVFIDGARKALGSYVKLMTQAPDRYSDEQINSEHDAEQILMQLAGMRQRLATVTAGDVTENVTVRKLSPGDMLAVRDQQAVIERAVLDLDDGIARANATVTITLPDEVVTVLRRHKLV